MSLAKHYQTRSAFTAYTATLFNEAKENIKLRREDDPSVIAEANEESYHDHDVYTLEERAQREYIRARLQEDLQRADLSDERVVAALRRVSQVRTEPHSVVKSALAGLTPEAPDDEVIHVGRVRSCVSFFGGASAGAGSSGASDAMLTPVLTSAQPFVVDILEEILQAHQKKGLLQRLHLRK